MTSDTLSAENRALIVRHTPSFLLSDLYCMAALVNSLLDAAREEGRRPATPAERGASFAENVTHPTAPEGGSLIGQPATPAEPIPMVLHCPACGLQHIDKPDTHDEAADKLLKNGEVPWDNPPHRSHLCLGCSHIWRPADVPTEGVAAIQTRGKAFAAPPHARGGTPYAELVEEARAEYEGIADDQISRQGRIIRRLAEALSAPPVVGGGNEPPWPQSDPGYFRKGVGWRAYYDGEPREASPYPDGELKAAREEGWDAAQAVEFAKGNRTQPHCARDHECRCLASNLDRTKCPSWRPT